MLPADPSDATESRAEQESDQDTPDTENPAENLAWPEVLAVRLSAERSSTASAHWPIPQPGRGARRTRSALQHARALPIVASASSRVTTRLCRFLC